MSHSPFPVKIVVTPPVLCKTECLRERILSYFPNCRFNETPSYFDEDQLIGFAKDADAIILGRDNLSEKVIANLPNLSMVAKYGVGLDNIDTGALERQGVKLGWTAGVNRRSVAELTLAFLLGLSHNVFLTGLQLKKGLWNKKGGELLSDKTVGVVGCGNIGQDLIELIAPFQCRVLVNDIESKTEFCRQHNAKECDLQDVLKQSDFITLHVPLTDKTRSMIDKDSLSIMKPSAYLINTSRGEVVDEAALKNALQQKTIAGAALDVFSTEPPQDREFLELENLMVTPHIGGNAKEAVEAMAVAAISKVVDYFSKKRSESSLDKV